MAAPALAGGAAPANAAQVLARTSAACRGHVLETATGGKLTEQIVTHGEGPETELVHICSSAPGREYTYPEGPEGYAYSFDATGLVFAGGNVAAIAAGWVNEAPKLTVVSLASHKVLFQKALPEDSANRETILVGKIVVRNDGAVAWTQLATSGACAVLEHSSRGTHLLDPARKAEAKSLTLSGETLRWSEAGEQHTARLR